MYRTFNLIVKIRFKDVPPLVSACLMAIQEKQILAGLTLLESKRKLGVTTHFSETISFNLEKNAIY